MTTPRITTRIELKPEHYVGDMSITLHCRPSEMHSAKLLLEILSGIEGWEIRRNETQTDEKPV